MTDDKDLTVMGHLFFDVYRLKEPYLVIKYIMRNRIQVEQIG